jgi:hypothetical protein
VGVKPPKDRWMVGVSQRRRQLPPLPPRHAGIAERNSRKAALRKIRRWGLSTGRGRERQPGALSHGVPGYRNPAKSCDAKSTPRFPRARLSVPYLDELVTVGMRTVLYRCGRSSCIFFEKAGQSSGST